MNFQRDYGSGKIWEWNKTLLTDEHIIMLNKMAMAKSSKIRLQGKQYYSDFELTEKQKDALENIVKVAKLII